MPFVKLDTGILDSTLWIERECREVFITALLMADPHELREATHTIKIGSLDHDEFVIPPGWYGFIAAAGPDDHLVGIRSGTEVIGRARPECLAVAQPRLEAGNRRQLRRRRVRYNHGGALLNGDSVV